MATLLTNSTIKTRVAQNLGNMQSGDIFYTRLQDWVNAALNQLILRSLTNGKANLNLFPELMTRWTNITTVDTNYLDLPNDLLAVQRIFSFDDSAVPNLNNDQAYPMEFVPVTTFELLPKDTGISQYPRLWTRLGNRIMVHPTPRTGKTTYLLLHGIMKEPELSADADTPRISSLWHPAWQDMACHLGASDMGWDEDAQAWLDRCDRKISQVLSLTGLQGQAQTVNVQAAGVKEAMNG